MPSIRLRIALSVFSTVVVLLVLQFLFVLDRVERAGRLEKDARLREGLADVERVLGSPELQRWIDAEVNERTKWDAFFIEVRDAEGGLVAASPGLPPGGLRPEEAPGNGPVRYWEMVHPTSRKGHLRIRVAETRLGGFLVRLGESLKLQQKTYWDLRQQLAYILLAIGALGGVAAWVVATRALRPVGRISARALELGGTREGELPRTGTGDELDQLASVLNDLLGRIRSEVARVRRMTADVSHALRSPLTAIRGTLELLLGRSSGETANELSEILEEVDRLIRLANRLLLLEKLEAGAQSNDRSSTDLAEIARATIEHLRVVAEDRGIELRTWLDPVRVQVDRNQLSEAIVNLLDNALRHTPRGGTIDVSVRRLGGRVELVVLDSGPGLPPGSLERIFERFYSEGSPGEGTGLGLAIARAVARAHGGELRASSPGGARFALELPLDDPVRQF